ncbi:hypothetical protein HYT18_02165 [Candidatus Microgenomates bacterium]|nr:hypothetical protein [Candidatus Microgenomates bacterium]
MRKELILIGLVLVSIVVVSAIGIFLSRRTNPTPSPTPNSGLTLTNQFLPEVNTQTNYPTEVGPDWETYENTKYGYSIKYPPFWATIINVTPTSGKETLETATSLDIFDSAAQKSYPDGVMTIQYLSTAPSSPASFSRSEITLNGLKVQKFAGTEDNLHIEIYLIPSGDDVIEIEFRYLPEDAIVQTFTAMLQTFQPTK